MISPVVALIGGRTQDGKPFRENIAVELGESHMCSLLSFLFVTIYFRIHSSLFSFPSILNGEISMVGEEYVGSRLMY